MPEMNDHSTGPSGNRIVFLARRSSHSIREGSWPMNHPLLDSAKARIAYALSPENQPQTQRVVDRKVAAQPQQARLDPPRLRCLRDQPSVAEQRNSMAAACQAEQEIDQCDLTTTPLGRTVVGDDP